MRRSPAFGPADAVRDAVISSPMEGPGTRDAPRGLASLFPELRVDRRVRGSRVPGRRLFVGSLATAASFIRPFLCATGVQAMDVQPWSSTRSPPDRAGVEPGRRSGGSAYSRICRAHMILAGSIAKALHAPCLHPAPLNSCATALLQDGCGHHRRGGRGVGLRCFESAGLDRVRR